jgi:hypothetical protein
MKNLPTGAAQSVTDTNERVRKLFENRPLNAPVPQERRNFNSRKKQPVAAVEEDEDHGAAPEMEASGEGGSEADEAPLTEEEPDDQ